VSNDFTGGMTRGLKGTEERGGGGRRTDCSNALSSEMEKGAAHANEKSTENKGGGGRLVDDRGEEQDPNLALRLKKGGEASALD